MLLIRQPAHTSREVRQVPRVHVYTCYNFFMSLKSVRLAAGQLYYLEEGIGDTVLFLHGAFATSEAYAPLLTLLSTCYHVVAPIHPGHGKSFSLPKDWKLNDYVSFYESFLADIDFSPRYLIGHSFGGTIALLLAACGIGKHAIVLDAPGLPFQFKLTEYTKALLEETKDVLQKRSDKKQFLDTTKAAGTMFQTAILHPDAFSLFTKHGPKFDIYKELKRIAIPVDILWGEDDRVVPVEVGKQIQQFIPHSHLCVFPHRGHGYPITDPQFTYELIQNVIRQ